MKKSYKEEKIESEVILDANSITPIRHILSSHSRLYIQFPSLEYSFPSKTLLRIIVMSSHIPEEAIRFTYIVKEYKKRQEPKPLIKDLRHTQHNKHPVNDKDSIILPMTKEFNEEVKPKSEFIGAITEEPLHINASMQMRLNPHDNQDMDDKSLDLKYIGMIGRNLGLTMSLWTILYIVLTSLGIAFGFHAWNLYYWNNSSQFTIGIGCDFAVAIFSIIIGTVAIFVLIDFYTKKKIKKESLTLLPLKIINILIIVDLVLSCGLLLSFNYFINDISITSYLTRETYFNWLIGLMILTQFSSLIFNFKMQNFLEECLQMADFTIPLLE